MSEATGQLILKFGFGLILMVIAWTVVASMVFLFGTGLLHDFPHPFWQWWLYALHFDGNLRVAVWLKIGAAAGAVFPLGMVGAVIYRASRVVGPRLRRPLFGGVIKSPLAVTDNHGRAEWMSMTAARERFSGVNPSFGGIVALKNFANSSPAPFIAGVRTSRETIVARSDEDRDAFLRKRGFGKAETAKIISSVLHEEGRPPESVFDFVQGITAVARTKAHQDSRLELEGKAKTLLQRAA